MKLERRRFFVAPAALAALMLGPVSSPAHAAFLSFGPPKPLNSTAATDADQTTADDDVDREVSLANDGGSTWVATWSSDNPLGGTVGGDSDIFFARSTDDGQSWSSAAPAMAIAGSDGTAPDTSPRVAYGNGVFVIVFISSNNLGETPESDQDILFTRSTDGGQTWSAPQRVNSGGLSDSNFDLDLQPSIASDGAGRWVVAWKHNGLSVPTGDQVFFSYSTDDGATWQAQQPLGGLQSVSAGNGQGTSVAWTGSAFVAVWGSAQDLAGNGNDGDIFVSTIAVPAFAASAPALLNDNATSDGSTGKDSYPSLSADGSTLVAAWESKAGVGGSGSDSDILVSRSTNGGASWSSAAPLVSAATTDAGDDNFVAVANDGSVFLAAWDASDANDKASKKDRDIYLARSDDGGATWSARTRIATNSAKDKGNDTRVAIAANASSGTWDAAWQSTDTLSKTVGGDEDIFFVHSSQDCPALPVAAGSCFESTASGASSMIIKEGGDKDSFLWKFVKGPALDKAMDLGNPTASDDYVLCVYDEAGGTPELISELDIEGGGVCFVNACWTDVGTGYNYKHKYGLVAAASLTAGTAGTTKASVKAKGTFSAPTLPLVQNTVVRARLHNLANGKCFATDFSTSTSNTAGLFKAKAD